MAASYTGAKAALEALFRASWTQTAILVANADEARPSGEDGQPLPFVYFEIVGSGKRIYAVGAAATTWRMEREIQVHVFVRKGVGDAEASALAEAAGAIFEKRVLYADQTPGCYVRTWAASVDEDDDGEADEDGLYYRRTMRCPFEYWHRG